MQLLQTEEHSRVLSKWIYFYHFYFQLSKARAGVTNTQRQLYEYDAENYQLKEKANHLEIQLAERYEELDKLRNQQERSNIEHSNVLTEKDRQIASLLESQREQSVEASLSSQLELSDITQTSGGLQSVDIYRCVSEDNILEIEMEGQLCADSEPQKEEDEDHLLEIQLAELTSKLDRMETEMCLVSEESKNLQQAVEIKDSVIVDQVAIFLHQYIAYFLVQHHATTLSHYHEHTVSFLVHRHYFLFLCFPL